MRKIGDEKDRREEREKERERGRGRERERERQAAKCRLTFSRVEMENLKTVQSAICCPTDD
jgi:hypothetical protein